MSDTVYLATQAILDRNENIYAYELLFRSPASSKQAQVFDNVQATSRVLVNTLNSIGIDSLLGNKIGFINLNEEMLHDEVIDLLPKDKFMLEILEFTAVDEKLVSRIQELKQQGYHFAIDDLILDDEMLAHFAPLFPLVDLLKIEVIDMNADSLRQTMEKFKPLGVKLLAEKVENREMFELCHSLGFDFFQGYYFSKPVIIEKKSLEPGKLTLTKVISQISTGEPPQVIENTFKEAPALSTSLFRYMNSAAMNLRREVGSIKHAINLIGSKKLMQWVILISYASDGKSPAEDPLLQLVQQRSKTMEVLAALIPGSINSDEAFIVGLLSLMDTLYGMPLEEVIASMTLDEQISSAILKEQGPLGHLLKIVRYLENEQFLEVDLFSQELGLDSKAVNEAQLSAIQWANEISKAI